MITLPALRTLALITLTAAFVPCLSPLAEAAQFTQEEEAQIILISAPSGYIGVYIRDVDETRAATLKLKGPGGAEIVALDHDAPACKAGLRVEDVILSIGGTEIVSADQLRRAMREMPAGKRVTVAFSRQGKLMEAKLQLADREALAQQAWARHFSVPEPDPAPTIQTFAGGNSFTGKSLAAPPPDGSVLYIGAVVDPVGPQLGKYFGVRDGTGLLVRSVEADSPAAVAGLRAGDVVLTANGTRLTSRADWMASLRASEGRPVQLMVVRHRKEQPVTLTLTPLKTNSELLLPEFVPGTLGAQQVMLLAVLEIGAPASPSDGVPCLFAR